MTITDEIRATNGHAKGRAVGEKPAIILSSGHRVTVNRQPGNVVSKVQAAARAELEPEKPPIPTQSLETEPGVFKDIPNEGDPTYRRALALWEASLATRVAEKLLLIVSQIALDFEVDQSKLSSLRDAYTAIGIDLPENDRVAWLSYVLAPTDADQRLLMVEVYKEGLPTEQQVAFQQAMFPRDVSGDAA